jgi:hypothetical protein
VYVRARGPQPADDACRNKSLPRIESHRGGVQLAHVQQQAREPLFFRPADDGVNQRRSNALATCFGRYLHREQIGRAVPVDVTGASNDSHIEIANDRNKCDWRCQLSGGRARASSKVVSNASGTSLSARSRIARSLPSSPTRNRSMFGKCILDPVVGASCVGQSG